MLMFWKILGLLCLAFVLLYTLKRLKETVANLVYAYSVDDETLVRNYRGEFQRKELASLNWINLTMNLLLVANIAAVGFFLMGGRPLWMTLNLAIIGFLMTLVTIFFAYGSNTAVYERVSPHVINAKNINDFSGDEKDLYFDTQNNIEQTYILLFVSILVLILTIFTQSSLG